MRRAGALFPLLVACLASFAPAEADAAARMRSRIEERAALRAKLAKGRWQRTKARWVEVPPEVQQEDVIPKRWPGTLIVRSLGRAIAVESDVLQKRGGTLGILRRRLLGTIPPGTGLTRETRRLKRRAFEEALEGMRKTFIRPVRTRTLHAGALRAVRRFGDRAKGEGEASELAIMGAVDALKDRYSVFQDAEVTAIYNAERANQGVGLGADVRPPRLRIREVYPDSPAARAGLRTGDRIIAVEGQRVSSNQDLFGQMLGQTGKPLRFEVLRRGRALSLEVVPGPYQGRPARARLSRDGVAVVDFSHFYVGVAKDVRQALAAAAPDPSRLRALVLDLRGNPGGDLQAMREFLGDFFEDGSLGQIRGRGGKVLADLRVTEPGVYRHLPVVVLVDRDSASAAEVVAAAFKDRRRGLVIGETTGRKLAGQAAIELPDATSLHITFATYHTPTGQSLHGKGVRPDLSAREARRRVRADSLGSGAAASDDPVFRKADGVLRYALRYLAHSG